MEKGFLVNVSLFVMSFSFLKKQSFSDEMTNCEDYHLWKQRQLLIHALQVTDIFGLKNIIQKSPIHFVKSLLMIKLNEISLLPSFPFINKLIMFVCHQLKPTSTWWKWMGESFLVCWREPLE